MEKKTKQKRSGHVWGDKIKMMQKLASMNQN